MTTAVRQARREDADAITHVTNVAFAVEKFFTPVDRTSTERVAALMEKGSFLLAERAAELIGSVYVELRGERVYIGLLAVLPAHQRSGVGRQLMDAAERFGRAHGCTLSEITVVNIRTELPAFYHRLGYAATGTLPFDRDEPVTRECHFVVMSKRL